MDNIYVLWAGDTFYFSLLYSLKNFHYILRPFCWLSCFGTVASKREYSNGEIHSIYVNHVSMFDQFMVVAYLKHYTTAIGAHEEFRWPIFGWQKNMEEFLLIKTFKKSHWNIESC